MAIKTTVKVDARKMVAAFNRFSAKDKMHLLERYVRADSKGFIRDIIEITPPGHQKAPLKTGSKGEKAVEVARRKISKHLRQIFEPVTAKVIRSGAGTAQPSFSDMKAHHRKHWKNGKMSKANPKMIVPVLAYEYFREYLRKKIGILAGSWGAAAKELKQTIPAIARKHRSGLVRPMSSKDKYVMSMTNTIDYATDADVKRRSDWVLKSRKRDLRLRKRLIYDIEAKLKGRLKAP